MVVFDWPACRSPGGFQDSRLTNMDAMFQIGLANASPAGKKIALGSDYEENVWLTNSPLRILRKAGTAGGRTAGDKTAGDKAAASAGQPGHAHQSVHQQSNDAQRQHARRPEGDQPEDAATPHQ
jgi:hypothetical protein